MRSRSLGSIPKGASPALRAAGRVSSQPGCDAKGGLNWIWSGAPQGSFRLVQIIVFILAAVKNSIYSCSLKSPCCPGSQGPRSCGVLHPSCRLDWVRSLHLSSATNASWKILLSLTMERERGPMNPAKIPYWGQNLYLFYFRESLPQDLTFQSGLVRMERVACSSKHTKF